jgi:DNA-binding CsgD family transcriptional regulator
MADPGTQPAAGTGLPTPPEAGDDAEMGPPGGFHMAAPTALAGGVAICIVADLVADIRAGEPVAHMTGMILGAILSFASLLLMWRLLKASRAQARVLEVALDASRADLMDWRSKAAGMLHGLGALIYRQFEAWGLSPAESEVGMLLLKGLSLKDIAETRQTTERTARQQALALYHKAGLAGRAELSAFFLEDLLLPHPGPGDEAPAPRPASPLDGKRAERSAA